MLETLDCQRDWIIVYNLGWYLVVAGILAAMTLHAALMKLSTKPNDLPY